MEGILDCEDFLFFHEIYDKAGFQFRIVQRGLLEYYQKEKGVQVFQYAKPKDSGFYTYEIYRFQKHVKTVNCYKEALKTLKNLV